MSDRGDGTYRNPVLFADYSDPDVVRAGDDYYLVASSFTCVPGLPILHSRDLVNWTIVNHALPALVPAAHFAVPRHGGGVWAPSLRHHDGRFWIYYPDPDFGLYVVTASDPAGAWSAPVLVKAGRGLIDPCPLWDEDGQGYLVHGWAASRSGRSNLLTLNRLSADGTRVLDGEGIVIIDENRAGRGWHTLEGPKLHRLRGYYWVLAPAGGVASGYQAAYRARRIEGPYESRVVLAQGATPVNGPHQGALVDTPAGGWWFLHFQDRGPYGRVVHLQPVVWRDDWPVIGRAAGADGAGEPVPVHPKPADGPAAAPQTSDEFDGPGLGLQWQWQANPQPGWSSLQARPGWLRLYAHPAAAPANLWPQPGLLLQKFSAPVFAATAALELTAGAPGTRAGLVVFADNYAWIGLVRTAAGLRVSQIVCADARNGGTEIEIAGAAVSSASVQLRVDVGADARCRFGYSLDGRNFTPLGNAFAATVGRWVGSKVGLFALAPAGAAAGHADFDWFRVSAGAGEREVPGDAAAPEPA